MGPIFIFVEIYPVLLGDWIYQDRYPFFPTLILFYVKYFVHNSVCNEGLIWGFATVGKYDVPHS